MDKLGTKMLEHKIYGVAHIFLTTDWYSKKELLEIAESMSEADKRYEQHISQAMRKQNDTPPNANA